MKMIENTVSNSIEMMAGWTEQIQEAKEQTTYSIGGKLLERTRYGDETDSRGAELRPCRDCGVTKGQFHVPGCDVERCPSCDGQVITCRCPYDEDAEIRS
jgi:hypothetical protein